MSGDVRSTHFMLTDYARTGSDCVLIICGGGQSDLHPSFFTDLYNFEPRLLGSPFILL
jgi:hypothetical protein